MGRGSSTRETEVKKVRPQIYSSSQGTGGSKRDEKNDVCLFSFFGNVSIPLQRAGGLKHGDSAVIVPHATDQSSVVLYINGKNIGVYNSNYSQKIIECVAKGYTYEGIVDSVKITKTTAEVKFTVHGYAR